MSKDALLEWADTELTQKAQLAYEGQRIMQIFCF